MKQFRLIGFTLMALIAISAQTLDVQLQRAVLKEKASGDLTAAIEDYKKLAAGAGSNRSVAAQALLHEAQVYEKLGDADGKARATYERIVKEFGAEADAVAVARQRLVALGGQRPSGTISKRLLCEECGEWNDISSDGRWTVGTDWDSGDLEIRDISTGQVSRKLMLKTGNYKTSDEEAYQAIFSRDARQIAYIWDTAEKPSHTQLRIVANNPGAKPRIVADFPPQGGIYAPVDWTKDGKKLLVTASRPDRTQDIAWVSVTDGTLKPIKSVGWRWAGTGFQPRLSPDEKFIVFSALAVNPSKFPPTQTDSKDQHIYVISADGSTDNEIVRGSGLNNGPIWAHDGAHILFVSNRRDTFDLWSIPMRDGKAAGELQLVWSEVGRMSTIAVTQSSYFFYNSRKGGEDVFIANIRQDGKATNPHSLTEYVGANAGPSWSPDGKSIVFKRKRLNGNLWDLVVRSIETGEERPYTTGEPQFGHPTWYPDSKSLHIASPTPGLCCGRLDLSSEEVFTSAAVPGSANLLSRDGKTLYIERDPPPLSAITGATAGIAKEIAALNLATGEHKLIFSPKPGEGIYSFAISPDGRSFAVIAGPAVSKLGQPNECRLFTIAVDGTGEHELYKLQTLFVGWEHTLTWSHDGYIYFGLPGQTGAPDFRVNHLARIPAAGGVPQLLGIQIRSNPAQMSQYIDLSPDGSQIVFATDEANIDQIWALDNVQALLK